MHDMIQQACRIQLDFGLLDRHVVCVREDDEFFLAHQQQERDDGDDLEKCRIHLWLAGHLLGHPAGLEGMKRLRCCFPEPGWYEIIGIHLVNGIAL